ncbi:MAG: toprim domain-containing protein [Methylocella sp.]
MREAIEQFRVAIYSAGLNPPKVIEPNGKLHRFASNGKPNDDAGWYVFHDDGIPAGAFGDWRNGLSETWRADFGRRLSPQKEAAHRARVEAMRRAREAEDAKRKVEAREKAVLIWQAAETAPEDHTYLVKKGIKAYGLRMHDGALTVPMRDGAELHSLQFIGPEDDKRFLTGGRVSGCYLLIGKPGGTLCIVEGYATGASIHEAAGCAVAVAFNAGNPLLVARTLRANLPALRLIVCADDDASTPGNPGLSKAHEAAQAVGGLLAVPDFGRNRPDGATGFNDLHRRAGFVAGRAGIERAGAVEAGPAEEPNAWPEPKPIIAELKPVPSFDAETLLPEALRAWIIDEAERMPCPPDFIAAAALVALGARGCADTGLLGRMAMDARR